MGWFTSDAPIASSSQQPTSLDGTYTPLKRSERKACWEARDIYFGCLDKHGILDAVKESDTALKKCSGESELFERDCASSWVKYFKQKRVADFNKAQQMKKLEAEGAVPMQQAQQESKWKFW